MGFLDSMKGLVGANKDKVQQGVDKAADIAKDKLPDEHDGKVDKIADAATDQINKLEG